MCVSTGAPSQHDLRKTENEREQNCAKKYAAAADVVVVLCTLTIERHAGDEYQ